MKIAIDLTSFEKTHSGGKEQVTFNLMKGFTKLKLNKNIVIFCNSHSFENVNFLSPGAQIIIVKKPSLPFKTLEDMFFKTFVLSKHIRKENIDAILFPLPATGFFKPSVPSAVIPHDIQPISHGKRFGTFFRIYSLITYKLDFSHCNKIIAISNYDKNQIKKYYPAHTNKIIKIPNPIFINKFTNKTRNTKPYILAVNIQFKHKNIITLIKAFEKIASQISHTLILVGKISTETSFLKDYSQKSFYADRIKFTGFINEDELSSLLAGCSLTVNPSLYEGFGMTAVEAMIMKVPVLTSMECALPETTMGLCKYYYPTESETALGEKILESISNPPSMDELNKISIKIESEYNFEKIALKYWHMLKEMEKI